MKQISIFLIVYLLFDFTLSFLLFKKTDFWNNKHLNKPHWRIPSSIYHHDLLANTNEKEMWGSSQTTLITNSLGFRDYEVRKINKINFDKTRILLIGDSFIEGVGYNYEFTLAGLIREYLGEKYEILNSAVGSYSPSIYYFKTKHFINLGYKFNEALIFLDLSDIVDEKFIKFDDQDLVAANKTKKISFHKKIFYETGYLLRDNFLLFNFFSLLSDKTEKFKNYIKDRIGASKVYEKSFFKISSEDFSLYKMTHEDRAFWTFNENYYKEVESSIKQSELYLKKLFDLLKENGIKSTLIIYPWPTQIYFGDKYHSIYWENFSKKNNINYLSTYYKFQTSNPRKTIFENFILNDTHWNKKGTKKIFDSLVESNIISK